MMTSDHACMARALELRGSAGRFVIRKGYFLAEHVVGFN